MFKRNQEAVSPVIGVILMVAITVVLAAILYVWASTFVGTGKATPRAEMTITNKLEDYQFNVESVQGATKTIAVFDITYQIADPAGMTIKEDGVEKIYGLRNDIVNGQYVNLHWRITFFDGDNDGMMSPGDQFIIRGASHTDPTGSEPIYGISGNILRLKFDPTGHAIVEKVIV